MTRIVWRRLAPMALIALVAGIGAPAPSALALIAPAAPKVEVTSDGQAGSGRIHASVDIAAPATTVWRILTDCAGAPRLMVHLKSCRVTRQDAAGHWDEREQISRGSILPGVRTVIHADYEAPERVRFHRIGGDLPMLEGEWRLEPLQGGAGTRVTYDSRMAANFAAAGPIVRQVLRHDMPLTLANLRDACETAAARP